jgi:hypothetical protein
VEALWRDWAPWTFAFNLTRQPAIAVPIGLDEAGHAARRAGGGALYRDDLASAPPARWNARRACPWPTRRKPGRCAPSSTEGSPRHAPRHLHAPGRLQQELGALDASGAVLDLGAAEPLLRGQSMLDLAGAAPGAAGQGAGRRGEGARGAPGETLRADPRTPKNIFCVGKNYHEHAKEFAGSGFDDGARDVVPPFPVVFSKPHTSIIANGEPILSHLDPTGGLDYEGELGVVIGTGGRGIAKADALRHVFGYTIVNDVTRAHAAAPPPPVDPRQGPGRLRADGPGDPDGGRGARSPRAAADDACERGAASGRAGC